MAVAKLVADFSYSNAELLALAREAMAKILAGAEEVDVAGKRFRKADLDKIRAVIAELEQKTAAESRRQRKTIARIRREP